MNPEISFVELNDANCESVVELIRRNLGEFEEVGSVLASSFRRIDNILGTYAQEGAHFFVAEDAAAKTVIGGSGIGPLAGLPPSEGICEIRELVIDENYRGRGIGTNLIKHCLGFAKEMSYQRIYLETTPQMEHAQRLFKKFGFRPVTDAPGVTSNTQSGKLPSYFLLEDIAKAL